MKAMAQRSWKAGEPVELIELPDPQPRRHEVRVAVRAAGVNPADCQLIQGGPPRVLAGVIGPRPPVVLGVDFAGVIDAVGSGVSDFEPGDRVVGGANFALRQQGCFAESVVVRPNQICRVPDAVEFDVAAALSIPGVTAHRAVLELGRIRDVPQDQRRILVLGASGAVGQLIVQIGKLEGAFVVGVCSGRNAELVSDLGADVVLDYNEGDVLQLAREYGPFQIVTDCADAYSRAGCRSLLAKRGRYIMVSMHNLLDAGQILVPPFQTRTILGRPTGARLAPLMELAAAGQLTVHIAKRLPLDQLAEAVALSDSGRMTGKLILEP